MLAGWIGPLSTGRSGVGAWTPDAVQEDSTRKAQEEQALKPSRGKAEGR